MFADVGKSTSIVAQEFYRHPFAHDDQIGVAVAVKIGPLHIFDHSDFLQKGSRLWADVAEITLAIIIEDIAVHGYTVNHWGQTGTYKKVEVAIAVIVRCVHTGGRFKAESRQNLG